MSVFPQNNGTERHYPVSTNREFALAEIDVRRQRKKAGAKPASFALQQLLELAPQQLVVHIVVELHFGRLHNRPQ
jgi:hypothetical protein